MKELHCANPHCKLYKVPVKPEGLAFLYLPHRPMEPMWCSSWGEKRLNDRLCRQIRETLHIKPALSFISRFFTLFEEIAQCFLEAQEKETINIIRKQGGYILMADATEHRESKSTYHVVDALSGRLLAAEQLEKSDYQHIKPVRERVKKYGTPLTILSDDAVQRKVRLELFPENKWIYCQYHFLRNLGEKLLRELYDTLAEGVKELVWKFDNEAKPSEMPLKPRSQGKSTMNS